MKLLDLLAKLAFPLALILLAVVIYIVVMWLIAPEVIESPAKVEDGMSWYPLHLD